MRLRRAIKPGNFGLAWTKLLNYLRTKLHERRIVRRQTGATSWYYSSLLFYSPFLLLLASFSLSLISGCLNNPGKCRRSVNLFSLSGAAAAAGAERLTFFKPAAAEDTLRRFFERPGSLNPPADASTPPMQWCYCIDSFFLFFLSFSSFQLSPPACSECVSVCLREKIARLEEVTRCFTLSYGGLRATRKMWG